MTVHISLNYLGIDEGSQGSNPQSYSTRPHVADLFLVRISILYKDMNLTIISSIVPHNLIRQVQKIIPHEKKHLIHYRNPYISSVSLTHTILLYKINMP